MELGAARPSWHVLPLAPRELFETLSQHPPLVAQVLYNRGVRSTLDAQAFLEPEGTTSHEAWLLPHAREAVDRISRAIRDEETIAVFGDFDADGVTASAVLHEVLTGLDARVLTYIPDRVAEGHGLNLDAIRELHRQGVGLIITADCGVTDREQVAAAADLGVDVVITDHHSPPEVLPEAVAIVNPKLDSSPTPYSVLASVGVAYKLGEALYQGIGREIDKSLLELVGLGTVADVSPLTGENRYLLREALRYLNNTSRPGIRALLDVAGIDRGQVDAEAIAFSLGPRINAPGRIDHASPAFKLLTARSSEEAVPLAQEVDAQNLKRRALTTEILARVDDELARKEKLDPILIVGDAAFPPGVIGLAAGRLREQYYRPSIVYQWGPEEVRASCRSIPEFDMIAALRRCDGLFTRYGGHAQAAGFTIPTEKLSALREQLLTIAGEELAGLDLAPRIVIDAQISLPKLTSEVIRALRELGPHGQGNPAPTFLARGVEVREVRRMGVQGQHLRLKLRVGGVAWSAVCFNAPPFPDPPPERADLVFTIAVDHWSGNGMLQLRVVDMAPVGSPAQLPLAAAG
jgi:single-stranded-DNA-specific exonuclease